MFRDVPPEHFSISVDYRLSSLKNTQNYPSTPIVHEIRTKNVSLGDMKNLQKFRNLRKINIFEKVKLIEIMKFSQISEILMIFHIPLATRFWFAFHA